LAIKTDVIDLALLRGWHCDRPDRRCGHRMQSLSAAETATRPQAGEWSSAETPTRHATWIIRTDRRRVCAANDSSNGRRVLRECGVEW